MIVRHLVVVFRLALVAVAHMVQPAGRSPLEMHRTAHRLLAQERGGQFGLGAVLGVAWAPCTGPALGAALGLAAQAGTAAQASLVMAAFALGAALPLLALGTVARSAMPGLRRRLAQAGGWGRPALGGVLALVGVAMLSGLDRRVEAVLTAALPNGWMDLITRF